MSVPAEPAERADLLEVLSLLDRLREVVASARGLPMSASCLVHREDVLALVDALRDRLPHALVRAQDLLGDREAVVHDGRREAERIVAAAHEQRDRVLDGADVLQHARGEADRIVDVARAQAAALRTETERYVDGKLATFEIVLGRTMQAVERGRARLGGEHEFDVLRDDADTARVEAGMLAAADDVVRLPR